MTREKKDEIGRRERSHVIDVRILRLKSTDAGSEGRRSSDTSTIEMDFPAERRKPQRREVVGMMGGASQRVVTVDPGRNSTIGVEIGREYLKF